MIKAGGGADAGDTGTPDVGGTTALGKAVDSSTVGDNASEDDAGEGDAGEGDAGDDAGKAVNTLLVVAAASPVSERGVAQPTIEQPSSTVSETIEQRHEPATSSSPLERSTPRVRPALPAAPHHHG